MCRCQWSDRTPIIARESKEDAHAQLTQEGNQSMRCPRKQRQREHGRAIEERGKGGVWGLGRGQWKKVTIGRPWSMGDPSTMKLHQICQNKRLADLTPLFSLEAWRILVPTQGAMDAAWRKPCEKGTVNIRDCHTLALRLRGQETWAACYIQWSNPLNSTKNV